MNDRRHRTRYRPLEGPIRQFLRERGMTITQLADETNISRSTLSLVINQSRPMTWDVGHEIAVALGVRDDAVMEALTDPDAEAVAQ
jgi:gp16 family phage-associated protein